MSERVAEARYQRLLELTSSVELATTIADLEQKKPFDDNLHLSPSDAPGQQQSGRTDLSDLKQRLVDVRLAEAEASRLWDILHQAHEPVTVRAMELALKSSPPRCATVLPSCREARNAMLALLAARKRELEHWQSRLRQLVEDRCDLVDAEAALEEFARASAEAAALLHEQAAALEQHRSEAAATAKETLTLLLSTSPLSLHTDADCM